MFLWFINLRNAAEAPFDKVCWRHMEFFLLYGQSRAILLRIWRTQYMNATGGNLAEFLWYRNFYKNF